MLPETFEFRSRPVRLIHHAAHCHHNEPAGSLAALESCLESGAALVEIDVLPLMDGSFALLHDRDLSVETSGAGDAVRATRREVDALTYKVDEQISTEKIGFLEGAIDLLKAHPHTQRLQLDLKPYTPLTRAILRDFVGLLEPVADRIQVTSVADWAIRSLRQFAPELALGFDPLLYLDLEENVPRPEGIPPFRVGAYGLRDDHPLSAYVWGPAGEYFAARAAALWVQAPQGCEWYLRAEVLAMALRAGFDWIDFLHQHGSTVDGWTIDVDQPAQVKMAQFLVERGIDELTTDSPARLAALLPSETVL